MAHDVSRLKELLFESESRTLSDLGQRMDAVFERAGTQERFAASVAAVLDDALRQAEVDRHAEVAQAIAPLIVKTIKTEIHGSQDELAEALYPAMGRMVRAYVVSAFRDLTDEINRRLEANRFMLRVRSLLTGRPVAELALAAGPRQQVEEIYLVRRGSGELVGHWPKTKTGTEGGNLREHAQGGLLAAVNDVATEAFVADEAALRRIDLGSAHVYLRASPAHLLAVKCSGTAPPTIEQAIDEQFIATVERLRVHANGPAPEGTENLLSGLASRLDTAFGEQHARRPIRAGWSPAIILLWGLLLLLAAGTAWGVYSSYLNARARAVAETVIDGDPALRGYPLNVDVGSRGRRVALLGLAPTPAAAAAAVDHLRSALPNAQIADRTAALPGGLDEARSHIEKLQASLDRLAKDSADTASHAAQEAQQRRKDIEALRTEIGRVGEELTRRNTDTQASLEALRTDLARLAATTPRQRLEKWIETHAIFFEKETDYRDARASAALDELALLVMQSDVLLRVVGHTDEKGGQTHNAPLSLARATKVMSELTARGVPAARLVAVGRNDVANLSPTIGDSSPNRRVDFEIGFADEQKP